MAGNLEVTFLRDTEHGGAAAQPADTAAMLAQFVGAAQSSLDVAIYDFKLSGALSATVADAFKQAAGRGVKIRIGYDADKPQEQTIAAFEASGADPAPIGTEVWLEANLDGVAGITRKRIVSPGKQLMHSKYIVRDIDGEAPSVLMGSANFTDGAWTRQENNVLRLSSTALAKAYQADFHEMWNTGKITGTGKGSGGATELDGVPVSWEFSPGEGKTIDAHLASVIAQAQGKLRICSMLITSPAVMDALKAAIARGVTVDGVYDGGEMEGVEKSWEKFASEGHTTSATKLAAFRELAKHLTKKPSAKYSDDGPHDFMHNKALIADERIVVTGSYNFSANAEGNAENQVTIEDAAIGTSYANYVGKLIAQYG